MNDLDAPLVSVVVPAWNAAATLEETLRSVSAQTYPNLEIIIVDDGSTDRTPDLAAAYCARERRARLLRQDNAGVAAARNYGISHARGEWIAPVDADDLWNPAKIEKQVAAALAAASPPGFVYCWYHYVDDDSRVIGSRTGWLASGYAFRQLAYENFVGNGSAALFDRSAVRMAGGYEPGLRAEAGQGCEDLLLQLAIARFRPVAVVPEYLVGYRVQRGSMSSDHRQMRRSWELVYGAWRRRLGIPGRLARWALGMQMFHFAEDSFRRGRWLEGTRLLGQAIVLDPVRSGLHILYRLVRLGARLGRGRMGRRAGIPFDKAGSDIPFELDPDALPGFRSMLEQLDRARLLKLRSSDARDGDRLLVDAGNHQPKGAGTPVGHLDARKRERARAGLD